MASSPSQTAALTDLIASTLNLLSQFTAFLNPHTPLPLDLALSDPPHSLHVLRDAATLIKAHVTKISLLAINKPFTPSAIRKVLSELAATCLPALMSGVQICAREDGKWSALMSREVQARTRRVFGEMTTWLEEVRAVARGGGEDEEGRAARRRGSLRSTGVVWEGCDAVVELERLGVAGLAVQKAQQYRDTIRDAIEELREWKEGEDLESEGHDALLDSEDEGVEGDRESVEDIFHAANSMPKDRPELRALAEAADGKLKKVVLLYTALITRRLRTFDVVDDEEGDGDRAAAVMRLDRIMDGLNSIPHQVDELAGCFYDLDEGRVNGMLNSCVEEAKRAASAANKSWRGTEDEFTAWSKKWHDAIG